MVRSKMGRYWEQTKRWFLRTMWSFKIKRGQKRKYPKCVPAAKAARMTDSQRRSAVARKRAKPQGVGGKPTNVSTFTKKYYGGMIEI